MEKSSGHQVLINNDFYEDLEEQWYVRQDHPIALLRAENAIRAPWIANEIRGRVGEGAKVLDVGCGGGLLSNFLALEGHQVTGIDLSQSSLDIARKYDRTKSVSYRQANAYELPYQKESFDVVCATDVLEHVEDPKRLISEASRVLNPRGLFFFHTFNRNFFSYLMIIKGVEWFVKNTPPNMHVYPLFIKPAELKILCEGERLKVEIIKGLRPQLSSLSFWKMLLTRKVPENYQFVFVKSLSTGYCGVAVK